MREYTENIKRYCDMDKFAQSICEEMTLTEDEANKFISLLWEQSRADVVEVVRCKDCANGCHKTDTIVVCKILNKVMITEDFCSYGAKMDKE